jgi:hypothetical protein
VYKHVDLTAAAVLKTHVSLVVNPCFESSPAKQYTTDVDSKACQAMMLQHFDRRSSTSQLEACKSVALRHSCVEKQHMYTRAFMQQP